MRKKAELALHPSKDGSTGRIMNIPVDSKEGWILRYTKRELTGVRKRAEKKKCNTLPLNNPKLRVENTTKKAKGETKKQS